MKRENMAFAQRVESSLLKEFRKPIWRPFMNAMRAYELIKPGDKIAVCISGGKDSMLMAKLMQILQRHSEVPFDAEYLIMDPGYNEINRRKVESNAKSLDIPYTLFESDIFEIANSQEKNPCFLCAKMRRGCLYNKARELGCNKIALGHHFNDVIETTVMGMLWGGQLQGMIPKLHSKNFPGMELIRPLYRVHEEDIIAWKNAHELSFIQCACRFTENCTLCDNGGGGSKRQEVKQLLKRLNRDGGKVEKNVFNAIHMLQFDTFPGWKSKGVEHSFLETYDDVQTTVTGVEEE
ncbi:MAG: tRNA 2-thiocytidine biosynthesis protein TtcA [Oscillospiraceae bacterium]|nr:tRNA 2-thiocytidine biosynthesis protein TtcA [Oscillospiraceae bacterium]